MAGGRGDVGRRRGSVELSRLWYDSLTSEKIVLYAMRRRVGLGRQYVIYSQLMYAIVAILPPRRRRRLLEDQASWEPREASVRHPRLPPSACGARGTRP